MSISTLILLPLITHATEAESTSLGCFPDTCCHPTACELKANAEPSCPCTAVCLEPFCSDRYTASCEITDGKCELVKRYREGHGPSEEELATQWLNGLENGIVLNKSILSFQSNANYDVRHATSVHGEETIFEFRHTEACPYPDHWGNPEEAERHGYEDWGSLPGRFGAAGGMGTKDDRDWIEKKMAEDARNNVSDSSCRPRKWQLYFAFLGTWHSDVSLDELKDNFRSVTLRVIPTPGLKSSPEWDVYPRTPLSSFKEGVEILAYRNRFLKVRVRTHFSALQGYGPGPVVVPADASASDQAYFEIRKEFPLDLTLEARAVFDLGCFPDKCCNPTACELKASAEPPCMCTQVCQEPFCSDRYNASCEITDGKCELVKRYPISTAASPFVTTTLFGAVVMLLLAVVV